MVGGSTIRWSSKPGGRRYGGWKDPPAEAGYSPRRPRYVSSTRGLFQTFDPIRASNAAAPASLLLVTCFRQHVGHTTAGRPSSTMYLHSLARSVVRFWQRPHESASTPAERYSSIDGGFGSRLRRTHSGSLVDAGGGGDWPVDRWAEREPPDSIRAAVNTHHATPATTATAEYHVSLASDAMSLVRSLIGAKSTTE